jgi:hypothetical protein
MVHEREISAGRGQTASGPANHSLSEASSGTKHITPGKKITSGMICGKVWFGMIFYTTHKR